nr:hypothetical protein [Tanacetum cinerariifolium]
MLMFEINMIEQKIAFLDKATTMVTDVPESKSLKTEASPTQTAIGKALTNPLKAEVLLKNLLKVNTEPSSSTNSHSKLVNSSPPTLDVSQPNGASHQELLKKVLKAKDSPIYIKVISSIPDWNHEENYSPYHFIEIGLASSKKELQPSTVKKDDPDRSLLDTLAKIRVQNLRRIAEQILHSISEGERKINYADKHCIITSRSLAGSSEEDNLALHQYGLPFLKNTIEAS